MKSALHQLLLILVFSSVAFSRDGQAQDVLERLVSIRMENAEIKRVLNTLEKSSGVKFVYSPRAIGADRRISVRVSNQRLSDVLETVFKPLNIAYRMVGGQILLHAVAGTERADEERTGLTQAAEPAALFRIISGTVSDEAGAALPGVSVVLKGTQRGTTTNAQGQYQIDAPDGNSVLVFSFVGYQKQEVAVSNQTLLNVSLATDTKSLNEVVVVGYGSQKRTNITGSVVSVPIQNIKDQPVTGLDQALAGQVAGVQVSQTTGAPGGGITVRVRGTGSIGAGNEPLYVIDGFPLEVGYNQTSNPLAQINPNDIESMEVLKDASATAIYGSRGANGVIIITTRRGKAGQARLNLDVFTGWQEVSHKIPMMNATEYADMVRDAHTNSGFQNDIPPGFNNPAGFGEGTDWQDAIFRVAPMQNYQLTASGGNDRSRFLISGGYLKQEGLVINSGFERYSFRVNTDADLFPKVKVGVNLSPSYTLRRIVNAEGHFGSSENAVINAALVYSPTLPVYNPDGTYSTQTNFGYRFIQPENPVAIALETTNQRQQFQLISTAFAEWQILPHLTAKTNLGVNVNTARQNYFRPSILGFDSAPAPSVPSAFDNSFHAFDWLWENTLTYDRTFSGKHAVTGLVGYTSQKSDYLNNYIRSNQMPNDQVQTLNVATTFQTNGTGSGRSQWGLLSMLARLNYSYAEKYLLTATIRRDGSSRFGANNRWGTFPSVSAGWRLTEEPFIKTISVIDELKLRASYGLTGNNAIPNYGSIGLLSATNYNFGPALGTIVNGFSPSSFSNQSLGWESTRQLDAGMELGLWNSRIFLIAEYYQRVTKDLLLNVNVPQITGFTTVLKNIGSVENKGWEFSLSTRNLVNAFKWSTDVNVTFNRNKVLSLGPTGDPIFANTGLANSHKTEIGQPLGNIFGYKVDGVLMNQDAIRPNNSWANSRPGDLRFVDVNGDGIITPDDRTILGNPLPDVIYGMTNRFSYGNFELNILIQGVQGNEVLNLSRRFIAANANSNVLKENVNRWRSPQDPGNGQIPRANRSATGNNTALTSFFVEDGSFLRVRNITFGYTFPKAWQQALHLKGVRLYGGVQNALTSTRYKGYNPEVNTEGANPLAPGVDYGGYPVARTYTLGINATF
ncbi:TonB-dependent receptor [Nibrella saemangeumensis]